MTRSISKIIISHLGGFVFFLILLAIANILVPSIPSGVYSNIVGFFNINLFFLLLIMIVGLINEIFWNFYFPFNILAPISGSFLGVYIVMFIYRIWNFLNSLYIHSNIIIPIESIYFLVVLLTLIIGYITILARHGMPRKDWEEESEEWTRRRLERKRERLTRKINNVDRKLNKNVEWDDVGEEFKLALYNLGKNLNDLFDGKKNKKRKK
ncbi:Uncharacterised protein [uncultured archaeon]|nr:Uncharacterised protein [uncultured archaeon]